jgi:hypothetical protein
LKRKLSRAFGVARQKQKPQHIPQQLHATPLIFSSSHKHYSHFPHSSLLVRLPKWLRSASIKDVERYLPIRRSLAPIILDRQSFMRDRKVYVNVFYACDTWLSTFSIGWKCCKPRVLTFDEFLSIPPCTTGIHSTIDDTPVPPKPTGAETATLSSAAPADIELAQPVPRLPQAQNRPSPSPAPPESEDDDPSLEIPAGQTCRRRGCGATYTSGASREGESCVHHPGVPLFHEGSKGYTCCKRRVLEFDQFLMLEGCNTKNRHLFVGSGKKGSGSEEKLDSVRYEHPDWSYISPYSTKLTTSIDTTSTKHQPT